jgi:hypothetical protein
MKTYIQKQIEPVDIREIDEHSMDWTVNDTIENETDDNLSGNRHKKKL